MVFQPFFRGWTWKGSVFPALPLFMLQPHFCPCPELTRHSHGAHPEPWGGEMQLWQPNRSPSASLVIPLQDSVGTSFSAAWVIPAGDLHFVSTAWGHVSKTQTLSQVPSTFKWFLLSLLCANIGMVVAQRDVYPRHSGLLFPACSSWNQSPWQHCSPAHAALICTVMFAIPALVKSSLTGSPMLQHTHFFPKIWLKIRAVWL